MKRIWKEDSESKWRMRNEKDEEHKLSEKEEDEEQRPQTGGRWRTQMNEKWNKEQDCLTSDFRPL